jgi:hypothetical protein
MRSACFPGILAFVVCGTFSLAEEPGPGPADSVLSKEEAAEGFVGLFDGQTLDGWQGAVDGYAAIDGRLVLKRDGGGFLFSRREYGDFILRLQYKLEPGGNNGIGIRAPLESRPARAGMEIQILDDEHPSRKDLQPEQYCGSIYGAVPSRRGHVKPAGQWNSMEISARGSQIRVTLNGAVVVDVDMDTVGPRKIHDIELAGLHNKRGHLAICGHRDYVEFRKLRIKEL